MGTYGTGTQVVTGDAVVLDLRPARVPTRMLACGVDLGLILVATIAWGWGVDRVGGSGARVEALTILGALVLTFGYPIAMETLTRGRTVGAYAAGLRVVRDDGGSPRFRHTLVRWLAFWAVDFAIWTGFCGGLVCAVLNPQGKRLGDLMAGTIVIRLRAPKGPPPIPETAPDLATWTSQLELSRVGDALLTASRHFVQRSPGLRVHPGNQLGAELARKVAARTAPAPPRTLEPVEFLAAVVTERRRRETEKIHREWVPTAADLPQGWR
ncbi:MAG: RDD family protein [Propionibacteriaceae bacterium]